MTWAWLALAGALGALARYGVGSAVTRWGPAGFPWGTLCVNLIGCFALGYLSEMLFETPEAAVRVRLIAGTGFLGAFTTFSTFGVETVRAIEAGAWGVAVANVLANLLAGTALAALGFFVARSAG